MSELEVKACPQCGFMILGEREFCPDDLCERRLVRVSAKLKADGSIAFYEMQPRILQSDQLVLSPTKFSGCKVCGGRLAMIRGRHPGQPDREVCPTCATEKLEDLLQSQQPAQQEKQAVEKSDIDEIDDTSHSGGNNS